MDGSFQNDNAAPLLDDRPTAVGHALAALAPALPEQTARDLFRLLSHMLAAPSSSQIRQARLGLMLDIVSVGTGEFVSVATYDETRKRRQAEGEAWPASSTLILTYGSWTSVVELSYRLWRDGTSSGVPYSTQHQYTATRPYLRDEVTDALMRCRKDLGAWPSQSEYFEWARVSRQLSKRAGQRTHRFPGRGPIRKLFGDFDHALRTAQRRTVDQQARAQVPERAA